MPYKPKDPLTNCPFCEVSLDGEDTPNLHHHLTVCEQAPREADPTYLRP